MSNNSHAKVLRPSPSWWCTSGRRNTDSLLGFVQRFRVVLVLRGLDVLVDLVQLILLCSLGSNAHIDVGITTAPGV